ncbi:MAG: alanine--tRNA ligase [Planctomycetes bacterium]|nr:alanine--tRNA ligase [Planctomycetota bacterium]
MKPLTAAEIRERYLRFFEERGHRRMPSDSLVPANDPTLLFTGAGMNQFKDMFLGKGSLPWRRVTTAQKCLRVPDLEQVGQTPRHHTFFEMLGNFSFGDYFKKECIAWEWEFFAKVLGIPAERMVVTVYADDDEAFEIWRKHIGLPAERIFRFGEKENFWPSEAPSKGPNGPCGPCSEIYFDARPGESYPAQAGLSELPDDRFTEIGNCVFTQYDRRDGGALEPLPQKNIDVGLGLERITAVLAGARNNFETDLFRPYLDDLQRRSGRRYGADGTTDVRMRRISDHVRAVTFCIADGALPSNEGRGYVVRKILRRAVRDGYDLGIQKPFLHEMVDVVGAVMGDAYPEVREHAGQCRALIRSEEEGFAQVYRQGMARLEEFLARAPAPSRGAQRLLDGSGEFAFQLHDTYGFPIDISRQILAERGFVLDDEGFTRAMEEQRARARAAMGTADAVFVATVATMLHERKVPRTRFVGYEALRSEARIEALLDAKNQPIDEARAGQDVVLVTDLTPFYAQGGGQVGDRGRADSSTGRLAVTTTTAMEGYHLHRGKVESGVLRRGQAIELVVEEAARRATERNHTATHLLHAALKNVLGGHVSQAGSEVAPDRLRFDYTHGEKPTPEQLQAIEEEVNREILKATPVTARVCAQEEARAAGFVALFGEKYGDQVRTLAVGNYSKELCGGTHVANSGQIGTLRIVSETAISAGTRRLEAVTGTVALQMAREERQLLAEVARTLKSPNAEVLRRVEQLQGEIRDLRKQLDKATAADLDQVFAQLERGLEVQGRVRTVVLERAGLKMTEIQEVLQRAARSLAPFAGVVIAPGSGEVLVGAALSPDLAKVLKAGDVAKTVAQVLGGGGGGRPEFAQGKGSDLGKVPEAVATARSLLRAAGGSAGA